MISWNARKNGLKGIIITGTKSRICNNQGNSKKNTIHFLSFCFLFTSTAAGLTNGNSMKKEKKRKEKWIVLRWQGRIRPRRLSRALVQTVICSKRRYFSSKCHEILIRYLCVVWTNYKSFWPREAKHRGPRSVLVGVVLLLTLLKKVAKNAYNHIYLNYTLFKSDLNVIQHDSDVIQTWFRRGSTWFTWFKENQTLFRGDLLDIQTWIKLDIDGIQRDSTVILWSKRDPNVIQTWIVIQMYI